MADTRGKSLQTKAEKKSGHMVDLWLTKSGHMANTWGSHGGRIAHGHMAMANRAWRCGQSQPFFPKREPLSKLFGESYATGLPKG